MALREWPTHATALPFRLSGKSRGLIDRGPFAEMTVAEGVK
jgi:hypothetical protein